MPQAFAETAPLEGRVFGGVEQPEALEGVSVSIEGREGVSLTDASGAFSLDGVGEGPVVLYFELPNYEPVRLALTEEERQSPIEVSLEWMGEDYLSVTVVTTHRQSETASTTVLTPREINAAPHRNAEEILRQVPGLTLIQHGSEGKGHQFFLRGFDAIHGADLELTVDGLPINEWSNIHAQGYLDLSMILPELVQAVVVTKGPFTLDQGAFAMAGSADYRLGAPETDLGWRAAYTVGTTNRHRVFAGYSPSGGQGEQFVGLEATYDAGYGDNRELLRGTFNGRVNLFDREASGRLRLTGLGSYASFELPGTLRNDEVDAGLVGFYGVYDPLSRGRSGRGLLALDYELQRGPHSVMATAYGGYRRLDLLENFTGFLIYPEEGDRRSQAQETWSFGLVARHESEFGDQFAIHTGLGFRGDVFNQQEDNVGRELEVFAERRDLDGTQVIGHGLAGLRWTLGDRARIDAGARMDVIHVGVTDRLDDGAQGQETLVAVSPRVTASWRPLGNWRLFAAYGRGFRPPEARAFSSFEPQRNGIGEEVFTGGDPIATVSDGLEIGTRWDPGAWFGLSLSGFGTFIQRESVFDHVSGINLELNGTRRLGAELVLSSTPVSWLTLSADLTVVDARFTDSGARVPFAPWLVSGFRASVNHDSGFRAGLRVLTVAPRPLPHGATGATLVMTDATLGYQWRWLRLGLELENLLNRRLREGEYHYASHWRPGEPSSEIPVLHTTAGPPLNARFTLGVQF